MANHSNVSGPNVHTPYRQVFADDAARLADSTVYTAADLYKKAYQVDTGQSYTLTAVGGGGAPTWTADAGGGSGPTQEWLFEGKDGMAFSSGARRILLDVGTLVANAAYTVRIEYTAWQPTTQGISGSIHNIKQGVWSGSLWFGVSSLSESVNSTGSYQSGATIQGDFDGSLPLAIEFGAHKSENVYWTWKATVTEIDATAPIIP